MIILLNHYDKHPFYRIKKLRCNLAILGRKIIPWRTQKIHCGVGNFLDNIKKFGTPLEIILIVNSAKAEEPYEALQVSHPAIKKIIFRNDNIGFDFGAWAKGYEYLKNKGYEGELILMNSSVTGPHSSDWLECIREKFYRRSNVGLVGIAINWFNTLSGRVSDWTFSPHVQSYFLFTKTEIIDKAIEQNKGFFPGMQCTSKSDLILKGEIHLSKLVLDLGYSITCIWPGFEETFYQKGDPGQFSMDDPRCNKTYSNLVNALP